MEAVDLAYHWCEKEYEEKDLLFTKEGWFTDSSLLSSCYNVLLSGV